MSEFGDCIPVALEGISGEVVEFGSGKEEGFLYFLCNGSRVDYVGRTKTISSRIRTHKKEKQFERVFYIKALERDLDALESAVIKSLSPKLNRYINGKGLCAAEERAPLKYRLSYLKNAENLDAESFELITKEKGPYGVVQAIDGEFVGQYGYYDDDHLDEVVDQCEFCELAEERGVLLSEYDCDECVTDDLAVVYFGSLSGGYGLVRHSELRKVKNMDKEDAVAKKFMASWGCANG